jgi:predicted exporter
MRGVGRTFQEKQDVSRAEETIETLEKQLADLNAALEQEVDGLAQRFDPQAAALDTVSVKPRKTDVEVRFVTLAWGPGKP